MPTRAHARLFGALGVRGRWSDLLLVAIQTGLRVSELTSLRVRDISLRACAHVHVIGKTRPAGKNTLRQDRHTA